MDNKIYDMDGIDIAWCPGCGNFSILKSLKAALVELEIPPERLVISSGIGQAPKIPHYLRCNFFNGLHGRSLPVATAIKASNPTLVVIAEGGEGDNYGEGGNHFIHTIRRNPDIAHIVHNNMVYGLTKGQASPTSPLGMVTPVQVDGVFEEPFNPVAVAIALNAGFVARAFSGDMDQTRDLIKQAIQHPGYALVDVFQPCVTFNKLNTFKWFKDHTYYLDAAHDPANHAAAMAKAMESEKFPLGVIYRGPPRKPFEQCLPVYASDPRPLWQRPISPDTLARLIDTYRS